MTSGATPAGAHLAWSKGGEATFVAAGAGAVTLRSSVPWPPGSRLEGTLRAGAQEGALFRMKVHGCRRQEDGAFLLEGRPLDLTRALREAVSALVTPGEAASGPARRA